MLLLTHLFRMVLLVLRLTITNLKYMQRDFQTILIFYFQHGVTMAEWMISNGIKVFDKLMVVMLL